MNNILTQSYYPSEHSRIYTVATRIASFCRRLPICVTSERTLAPTVTSPQWLVYQHCINVLCPCPHWPASTRRASKNRYSLMKLINHYGQENSNSGGNEKPEAAVIGAPIIVMILLVARLTGGNRNRILFMFPFSFPSNSVVWFSATNTNFTTNIKLMSVMQINFFVERILCLTIDGRSI